MRKCSVTSCTPASPRTSSAIASAPTSASAARPKRATRSSMNCRGRRASRPGLTYPGSGLVAIGRDPTPRLDGSSLRRACPRWDPAMSRLGPAESRWSVSTTNPHCNETNRFGGVKAPHQERRPGRRRARDRSRGRAIAPLTATRVFPALPRRSSAQGGAGDGCDRPLGQDRVSGFVAFRSCDRASLGGSKRSSRRGSSSLLSATRSRLWPAGETTLSGEAGTSRWAVEAARVVVLTAGVSLCRPIG